MHLNQPPNVVHVPQRRAVRGHRPPHPQVAPLVLPQLAPPPRRVRGQLAPPPPVVPVQQQPNGRTGMPVLVKVLLWTVVGFAALVAFAALMVATLGFATFPIVLGVLVVRETRRRGRMRDAEHAAAVKGVRKLHSKARRHP